MKTFCKRYVLVCTLLIGSQSALGNQPFNIVADIPLGPSNLSSSCMTMAIDTNNISYLMGNTLSNNVGYIWLVKVNPTGTPISRRSIPLPNLKLHNKSRPVVKDMLLLGDQIFALLECEDNSRLAGVTKLMLLQLSKDGLVVTNYPLSIKAINAHMFQVDSECVWVIGQNKLDQQLRIAQVTLEHPDVEVSVDVTPAISVAANGVLMNILSAGKDSCLLLVECYNSILDRRLQILRLSSSGETTVIAPPFDGSGGVLSQPEKTVWSLAYKAPSLVELGNDSFKYYSDGRVRVYDIASSILCFDKSFNSPSLTSTSARFPVFGIENEQVVVKLATTNQFTGNVQYLSSKSNSMSITRQYAKGPMYYLLVRTIDWNTSRKKGEIAYHINLLMVNQKN